MAMGVLRFQSLQAGSVTRLEEAVGDGGRPLRRAGSSHIRDRGKALNALALEKIEVRPAGITATLRPYQAEGLAWLQRLRVLGAGGVLADVFEATLAEGCIVRVERLMSNSLWEWKSIEWQGEKIASVLEGMRGRKAHRQITYNGKGEIVDDLDLSEPPKRKPLPKGVTMQSLAKKIRGLLAKTVVTTVTKAKIKEPVYCLALNYDCEGNPLLLPELGIGLDSERKARLKSRSRDARRAIWELGEFSLFANDRTALRGRDRELDRACDLFNRELEFKASDEPARKLILEVAADLAKVDWAGKLNTTDDFIVYAVDTYGNDLRRNLKLSVPPKQLAKLKAAKLL